MKAVQIQEFGGPEVLRLTEVPPPVPGPGEVLVRVKASAINPLDNTVRAGRFPLAKRPPLILGEEAAGVVEQDSGVFRAGETVFVYGGDLGVKRDGAWADCGGAPASWLRPIPKQLSFEQAAGLANAGMTAIGTLRLLDAKRGQTILVLGATGGVGSAAVQIAKAWGVSVIAEVSKPEKQQRVVGLGADHIVVLSEGALDPQVRALTAGRGVDGVVDPIGGDVTGQALAALAPASRLVHLGSAAGQTVRFQSDDLLFRSAQIVGFNRFQVPPDRLTQDLHEVLRLVAAGKYRTALDRVFPFAEIAEAARYFEEGRGVGKVVLTW